MVHQWRNRRREQTYGHGERGGEGEMSGLGTRPTHLEPPERHPRWLSDKEFTCQCRRILFDILVGRIPWRRKWQPTPVCLPGGKSHGQRSLMGLVVTQYTSLSPGPGGQGKEGWPVCVTGVSYYGAETMQLTTSPGPWRMKEIPQRKKRLWIGHQKITAIKEGLSWIESSRPLAIQSQKPVIKSLGYGLKLDSIGPQLAVEKWALFQKDDKI